MRTLHWIVLLVVAIAITAVAAERIAAERLAPPPSPLRPVGAVRDLMKGIVEPSSNVIFQSAGYTVGANGVTDLRPQNDDQWSNVEHNALMLAEAANLLKMTGRTVARPDDTAPSTSDEAPELKPAQIEQKIAADRAMWIKYADGLQQQGLDALHAARTKDPDALLNVGDAIDKACENCHLEYWYPKEKKN